MPRLTGRVLKKLIMKDGDSGIPVLSKQQLIYIELLIRAVRRALVWSLSSAEAERTFPVVKAGAADPCWSSLSPSGRLLEVRLRLASLYLLKCWKGS